MEGITQEQIRQEAQEIYRAEREKSVLRPFTEKYPKIVPEESYRIQLALDAARASNQSRCWAKVQ